MADAEYAFVPAGTPCNVSNYGDTGKGLLQVRLRGVTCGVRAAKAPSGNVCGVTAALRGVLSFVACAGALTIAAIPCVCNPG